MFFGVVFFQCRLVVTFDLGLSSTPLALAVLVLFSIGSWLILGCFQSWVFRYLVAFELRPFRASYVCATTQPMNCLWDSSPGFLWADHSCFEIEN